MTRFYCFDPDEGAADWEHPREGTTGWEDDAEDDALLDRCPRCGELKEGAYDECDDCFNSTGEAA